MKNSNLHLFHINENLYLIETTTDKIKLRNGKTYDGWFFKDFYASFKREVPDLSINTDEFLSSLETNKKYIINVDGQKDNIIISLKQSYDEKIIQRIIEERTPKGVDPYENPEEDSFEIGSVKVYSNKETAKRRKQNTQENTYGKSKGLDTRFNSQDRGPKKNKGKNIDRDNYNKRKSYEENRQMILDAFRYASVFPVTAFQNMMQKEHKYAFDYKFAEANRVKSSRGKLSAYLDDCDDILERVCIRGSLYYMKTKIYGDFLANKRKSFHLKNLNIKKQEGKYHMEILITNMFPLKTTADIFEIEDLFEKVYGASFTSITGYSFIQFIQMMKSPNLILKGSLPNAKITVTPSFDDEHTLYGDNQLFKNILKIEENILNDTIEIISDALEKVIISESINDIIPMRYQEIFNSEDKVLHKLLKMADNNIPRSVQKIENIADNFSLFERCKGNVLGLDVAFFVLHQNLKLNECVINEEMGDYSEP